MIVRPWTLDAKFIVVLCHPLERVYLERGMGGSVAYWICLLDLPRG
ncbi:MAG: hypothetical protein AB8B99_07280 [Phormidesmis sp.]